MPHALAVRGGIEGTVERVEGIFATMLVFLEFLTSLTSSLVHEMVHEVGQEGATGSADGHKGASSLHRGGWHRLALSSLLLLYPSSSLSGYMSCHVMYDRISRAAESKNCQRAAAAAVLLVSARARETRESSQVRCLSHLTQKDTAQSASRSCNASSFSTNTPTTTGRPKVSQKTNTRQ